MAGIGPGSVQLNPSCALGTRAGGLLDEASYAINVDHSREQDNIFIQGCTLGGGSTTIHDHSPTGKDEWTGGDSTVPSTGPFMLDDLSIVLKLRDAVLKPACGQVAAVGVRGSGGVGKTSACTIVTRDQDPTNLYKDARVWIQLGDGASAATVVRQDARIVRETGGHSCAKEIEDARDKDLDGVGKMARSWLTRYSILSIVDNVFPTNKTHAPGGDWVSILPDIPNANSCVLFSTRSEEIAELSDAAVDFAPLESSEEQQKLLLKHLGRAPMQAEYTTTNFVWYTTFAWVFLWSLQPSRPSFVLSTAVCAMPWLV
jgi:hypothetical protein